MKGADEEIGNKIANLIFVVVKTLDQALDFRRMHRVIVTADFAGELAELSQSTVSGNAITHTNEDYAIAAAKVLLLPRGNEIEILPVLNAHFMAKLTENPQTEPFQMILHLLHHELCHVHDDNKKLDALAEYVLKHRYAGKDIFIRPLAEACWSEYIANRLSSGSAIDASVLGMCQSLTDAIERTKLQIDTEILSYRLHGDLDQLMGVFQRHGEFLVKSAAYVLGYMDGLGRSLLELSPQAAEILAGSYFEPAWNEMQSALGEMYGAYPGGWKNLEVYDPLVLTMEKYYTTMGLTLSTTEDGRAYVKIPFRPENTP
jgi:hypothetical protein